MLINWIVAALAKAAETVCPVNSASGLDMFDECTGPCTSSNTLSFLRAGTYSASDGGGSGDWAGALCKAADIGDTYEIKLEITLGDNPTSGPTLGVYADLNVTRSWVWETTTFGGLDANWTATVREKANTSNSGTFTGTAHTLVE